MTPRLRSCGNPDCPICRWRDEEHHDSGHPDDSLAQALVGTAILALIFVLLFIVWPVL